MMTVHKLSAGDGYTYLTRQVASADERRPSGQALADYYTARGNPPGVWMGAGSATLGLSGSEVSEAQMQALFGQGCHPDRDVMLAGGATKAETQLGRPYSRFTMLAPGEQRVRERVASFQAQTGRPPSAAEHNQISAEEARRVRRPVAGFDLVFTPVKSASLLWGLGGPEVRAAVEDAHHEAVASTIGWIEQHAAFTRTGTDGVAQIDTTGLVCAAFDHRESRTGDPDLHTHVAVSNKVCGVDGRWRALDARGLHALGVAASERYNTRFEDALALRLGVEFVERPGGARGKRPIREIDGVPLALIKHFSKRRAAIEDRYAELAADYRREHSREPDRSTQLRLAQAATLQTREGKEPGRRLADQVSDWTEQATDVVGRHGLEEMLSSAVGRRAGSASPTGDDVDRLARQVLATVSEQRSTWTRWNLYAEAERLLRPLRLTDRAARDQLTDAVIGRAASPSLSIRISEPALLAEPESLRRTSDGQSVFVGHGAERYTTSGILNAEEFLVSASRSSTDVAVDPIVVEAALAVHEATNRVRLDDGQRELVRAFASSTARLALGIGPAGVGKTTAMRAFAACWATAGGRVVPLAASSKAAEVLGADLGLRTENLQKFLHETRRTVPSDDTWFRLSHGDVVLVDEAGMAGTLQLAELVQTATRAGAAVRLLGDPSQLASVEAGGALRLLEAEVGSVHLDRLHRFADPAEAAATLRLRAGDTAALGFYKSNNRIRSGSRDAMLESAYDGWAADVQSGRTSVLVAVNGADVTALNTRARLERVACGQVSAGGVELHDGNRAGVGDWVVTRANLRGLTCHRGRDWVKNGDTWQVTGRHDDGTLTVRHLSHNGTVRLPAEYVADQVELAYATTVHRAQGTTVDTAHPLVTGEMTREALYVASTRGRSRTTWYVATEDLLDAACDHEPDSPLDARDVLAAVLGRVGAEESATQAIRSTLDDAESLCTLVARYEHARGLAAKDALVTVLAQTMPPGLARRVMDDPGVDRLANALADATAQGTDQAQVLRNAVDFDDLRGARSAARVLAARIEDYACSLGVPTGRSPERPLPWLGSPDVGHPGWRDYLDHRARLITNRARHLGSLAAAYREQYGPDSPRDEDLGEPPAPGTRRHVAYQAAMTDEGEQQALRQSLAPGPHTHEPPHRQPPPAAPVPRARPTHARGPTLSR